MRRGVAAVVAVAVAGGVFAIVLLGSGTHARLAGTNNIEAGSFVVVLKDGQQFCQQMFVPKDADRIRMTIGSYDAPMPAVDVTLKGPNGVVSHARNPAGVPQGVVTLKLGATTREPLPGGYVCVRPDGTKIALGGFQQLARVEFLRPGRESYFGIAGTMLHRFGIARPSWWGAWVGIVAVLLLIAVWTVTARTLLREDANA
jgi:hypothetical protein